MNSQPSTTVSQSDQSTTDTATEALTEEGIVTLEIGGDDKDRWASGYSFLIRGEIQAGSILSRDTPNPTITLLENDTKLVSGSISGDKAGFLLDGYVVAAEFDVPEPAVKVDGSFVDPERWPTVKEYLGHGPGQEPVEDPFPESGELGASPTDPLNPEEYIFELDAHELDEAEAYCFDIEGEIIGHSDGVSVSDKEDRVYGCLRPDGSARIEVRGVITRIDTANGIDFSIRPRNKSESTQADQ